MTDSNYYVVNGKAIALTKINSVRLVTPSSGHTINQVAARLATSSRLGIDTASKKNLLIVRGDTNKLEEIKTYSDVEYTRSAFVDPNGLELILTDEINISISDKKSESKIRELCLKLNCVIVDDSKKIWRIRVLDAADDAPLIIANRLSEEKGVEFAEPNALQQSVLATVAAPTEARFLNQWHLNNTGENGGVVNADVRALAAWGITYGSSNIRVVIHDSGVDIDHPDLIDNIDPGWDFDNNDSNASNNSGPHGTACAGVAVAPRNGVGVVGVAPGCRIVPLRAAGLLTWSEWANTFEWAAARGEIISCSWTISPNAILSTAIRDAANNGRGGKGTPIFFATGNGFASTIGYPASLNETIAIGASTNQDVRSGYSNFGMGIDFVAPSSGGTLKIETSDIQGVNGYNTNASPNGDYCNAADASGFGGTSSATPLAAGIGALMLSANPNLSVYQIRQIMRGACDKIDAGNAGYDTKGWSNQYGYGRINAAVAVQRATGAQMVVNNLGYSAGGWRVDRHPRFLVDLTGDGSTDVVGFGNAGVYAALNKGDGTFHSPRKVINGFGYTAGGWSVDKHPRFLSDLTGDGSADIVGFGNAGVHVALNNGDCTFQAPQKVVNSFGYTAGGWRVDKHPRFLTDLTGDGRADIVGFGNAGVYIVLNNGNGSFQAPQRVVDGFGYTAGGWRVDQHPRFLTDLTGDGRADIVGFGNAGVYVALNNGGGSFQATQKVVNSFGRTAGGWRVDRHPRFLADLTGDGRADIVGFGNAGVYVALNNGDGSFQAPQKVIDNFGYNAGGWRVDRHPRFVTDLTGDGRADIVGFGNAGVYVSFNNGDGTFQAPQMIAGSFGYTAGSWLVDRHPRFLADLTGNGRADIVGFGNAGVWSRSV